LTPHAALDTLPAMASRSTISMVPTTMRAAVYHGPRQLTVDERPVPEPGPADVLLRVRYCGICGSDLHFVLDGWGRPGSIEGHEFTGEVVAVGDDVSSWAVGDQVVGGPSPRCGACEFCRTGRPSLCTGREPVGETDHRSGAFAEYVCLPAKQLLRLPDDLSPRAAALAEPLAVALHALTQARAQRSTRLLITGAGPIGSLAVAAAHARGIDDVVVSEPRERRRELVERLGATAITPDQLVAPASPNLVNDAPFDAALECSGNGRAMESALEQLDRGGVLVLVGAGMSFPRFDSNRILLNELVVTGAYNYDSDGFDDALALLASPGFPLDVLVEPDDVDLEGLYGAIESLAAGEVAAKVMVTP